MHILLLIEVLSHHVTLHFFRRHVQLCAVRRYDCLTLRLLYPDLNSRVSVFRAVTWRLTCWGITPFAFSCRRLYSSC